MFVEENGLRVRIRIPENQLFPDEVIVKRRQKQTGEDHVRSYALATAPAVQGQGEAVRDAIWLLEDAVSAYENDGVFRYGWETEAREIIASLRTLPAEVPPAVNIAKNITEIHNHLTAEGVNVSVVLPSAVGGLLTGHYEWRLTVSEDDAIKRPLQEAIDFKWHHVLEANGGYQFSDFSKETWGALPIAVIETLRIAARHILQSAQSAKESGDGKT